MSRNYLKIDGQTDRSRRLSPGKPKRYTIDVKFVHMDEHIRDEILKFDFKKHRERLITRKSS